MCFEYFNHIWEGNHEGEKEIVLQFINTKGNLPRTEAYMGFENGNPFFGDYYPDIDLALKALEIVYRANGAAVGGLLIGMDTDGKW